jgi:endonuclease YncB( thermonuclease family)
MKRMQSLILSGVVSVLIVIGAFFFPDVRPVVWLRIEELITETFPSTSSESDTSMVKRVIDGDTFELANGETVRLIGIDAPESVKPQSPVECYGKEASAYLRERIEGKQVTLVRDVSERDRYQRLLRYVYLDTVFINEELVAQGFARAKRYPPDTREAEHLKRAEDQAHEAGRGLWDVHLCPVE